MGFISAFHFVLPPAYEEIELNGLARNSSAQYLAAFVKGKMNKKRVQSRFVEILAKRQKIQRPSLRKITLPVGNPKASSIENHESTDKST